MTISDWLNTPLGHALLSVVIAIVIVIVVRPLIRLVMVRFVHRTSHILMPHRDPAAHIRQITTLARFLNSIILLSVVIVTVFTVLKDFAIDVRPLLAGAGVVGLAIGFGAQSLVKDVIAGFFITLERYYAIDDEVEIEGFHGTVKHISLRTTVLVDKDGVYRFVPNSSITKVSNFSRR